MTPPPDAADPTCREALDLLSDYVDGELTPKIQRALDRHLEACPPCDRFLKTFQKTHELCREDLSEEMPEELRGRLRSFLRAQIRKKQ